MYVVAGSPILRHRSGERPLSPGELVAFPAGEAGANTLRGQGPGAAHQFVNHRETAARLITFLTPIGRPTSTFYPDEEAVVICVPGYGGSRFCLRDQVEDCWDGDRGSLGS